MDVQSQFLPSQLRVALSALVLGGAVSAFASLGSNQALLPSPPESEADAVTPTLSRYLLDVRLEPGRHRLSATAVIKLTGVDITKPLTFLLNRDLTVTSVRDGDKPAGFSRGSPDREAKPLQVKLAQSSESRGAREITIEYHGTIAPPGEKDPDWMGALVIRSNEARLTEQTKWYPMLNGLRAPFEASISLPGEFALVCPGETGKTTDGNGQATWKVVCSNAVAPALIAGVYTNITRAPVGVYLFPECADEAEAVLEQARDILGFLESRFGPRPFARLAICQMRVLNSRYSYNFACPGAVVLPSEIIRMARRADRKEFWTRKLAHEIAHQWWGCSVDLAREPWAMNESLSELSAVLYLQSLQPEKTLGSFLTGQVEEIRRFSSLARSGEVANAREYGKCLGYQKGPWVLAMLRELLGHKDFDRSLRAFYARYAFRQATQTDFRNSFGHGEAIPLQSFFEQWIDRPFLPRLTVEGVPSGKPGKGIVLRIRQAEPLFSLPLELRLTTAAGSAVTNCLLTRAQQEIETSIQGPLLYLEIDPQGKLLLESQSDTNELVKTLIQARGAYERVPIAVRANPAGTLYEDARELRDIFRRFSTALEIERHRKPLENRGPLHAKTKSQLEQYEKLKLALEAFFGKRGQMPTVGRLVRDIAESADDIHDAVRDKRPEGISPAVAKLTQAWEQFSQQVRACSGIEY